MSPQHLSGNYAPVTEELTAVDLPVTGRLPAELTGWYLRNGPNPADATSGHWFFGDGMVHGVRLDGGRATSYRNRWVRTSTFTGDARASDGKDESGDHGLAAGPANTHVVRHAGHTLALVESSFPYELTGELDTVGPYDFDGRLTTAMTAHPKTCPTTGQLHFFGYGARPPYLTYHRADAHGELVVSRPIDVAAGTMMHDFSLTADHVIFMDLPVVFSQERAAAGTMPYGWDDGYGARLGVLARDDPYGAVRWFEIDPCYVFHTVNAYDDGQTIVLHVLRYPYLARADARSAPEATLWRWTIDLGTGTVAETQLDDRSAEFPRIDDRLTGQRARYGHAVVAGSPGNEATDGALLRYDLDTGRVDAHDFGRGRIPGEAAFAPADDAAGGAGWLLSYVYDQRTDRSDLVVLDAAEVSAAPVATVHLPTRVPYGFHGNYLPDS